MMMDILSHHRISDSFSHTLMSAQCRFISLISLHLTVHLFSLPHPCQGEEHDLPRLSPC